LPDEIYYLNATADDILDNTNATETRTILLDTTGPSFTNLANQFITNLETLAYDIDASDAFSEIDCFTVNDTSNFSINCSGYLTNATSLSGGLYWINITVNDTLGNENYGVISINVSDVDVTSPVITITYPQNASYTSVTSLNYSVTESFPDSCWYSLDLGVTNSSSVTSGQDFVGLTSNNGSNTWTVYCNDTSNNNGSSSVTFTIDLTAPLIEIISPSNRSYGNATILVNVSSDGDNIWYNWNGTNVTYTGAVNVTFSEGSNTLVIYANDSAGNLNVTNITFTIDLDGPIVTLISPINGSTVTASSVVDFEYNVTDQSTIDNC